MYSLCSAVKVCSSTGDLVIISEETTGLIQTLVEVDKDLDSMVMAINNGTANTSEVLSTYNATFLEKVESVRRRIKQVNDTVLSVVDETRTWEDATSSEISSSADQIEIVRTSTLLSTAGEVEALRYASLNLSAQVRSAHTTRQDEAVAVEKLEVDLAFIEEEVNTLWHETLLINSSLLLPSAVSFTPVFDEFGSCTAPTSSCEKGQERRGVKHCVSNDDGTLFEASACADRVGEQEYTRECGGCRVQAVSKCSECTQLGGSSYKCGYSTMLSSTVACMTWADVPVDLDECIKYKVDSGLYADVNMSKCSWEPLRSFYGGGNNGQGVLFDGDAHTAVVSSTGNGGEVILYTRTEYSDEFKLDQKFKFSTVPVPGDVGFFTAISPDSNFIAAASPFLSTSLGANSGGAYLLRRNASGLFEYGGDLYATTPASPGGQEFGSALRFNPSSQYLAIGAAFDIPAGHSTSSGVIYLYEQVEEEGSAVFRNHSVVFNDVETIQRLGTSIAFGRSFLVGGAPKTNGKGAVFLYSWNGTAVVHMDTPFVLSANDSASTDDFGCSVAMTLSEDIIAVGARNHDRGAGQQDHGAVYIFAFDPVTHQPYQLQKIEVSDSNDNDVFGTSVALSSTFPYLLAVGAPGDVLASKRCGAVTVLAADASLHFSKVEKLQANWCEEVGDTGRSLAISIDGRYVLAGSPQHSTNRGRAVMYVVA